MADQLQYGQWSCERCTFINEAHLLKCGMCDSPAPRPAADPLHSIPEGMFDNAAAEAGGTTGGAADDAVPADIDQLTEFEGVQILFQGVKQQLDVEKYILFQVRAAPCSVGARPCRSSHAHAWRLLRGQPVRDACQSALRHKENPKSLAFARDCFERIFDIMMVQQGYVAPPLLAVQCAARARCLTCGCGVQTHEDVCAQFEELSAGNRRGRQVHLVPSTAGRPHLAALRVASREPVQAVLRWHQGMCGASS